MTLAGGGGREGAGRGSALVSAGQPWPHPRIGSGSLTPPVSAAPASHALRLCPAHSSLPPSLPGPLSAGRAIGACADSTTCLCALMPFGLYRSRPATVQFYARFLAKGWRHSEGVEPAQSRSAVCVGARELPRGPASTCALVVRRENAADLAAGVLSKIPAPA